MFCAARPASKSTRPPPRRDHDHHDQAGVEDVAGPVDDVGHRGRGLALDHDEPTGLAVAGAAGQASGVEDAPRGLIRDRRPRVVAAVALAGHGEVDVHASAG
jgi:hypothetical protein